MGDKTMPIKAIRARVGDLVRRMNCQRWYVVLRINGNELVCRDKGNPDRVIRISGNEYLAIWDK